MPGKKLIDVDVRKEIGAVLHRVRKNLKLSRREISESTFVCTSSIYDIEKGIYVTQTLCHHLWIAYSDYFYNCMQDPNDCKLIRNPTDIERDLGFVETVLYGDKED